MHKFHSTCTSVIHNIHKTNVLTKFHDDWTKNVTNTVKKTPRPGGHVFFTDPNHCLNQPSYQRNKYWTKNVSYRLFSCFHYIHIEKTAPPPGGHVFQMFTTIFKLVRYPHKQLTPTPRGGHVCLPIQTIFELNLRIQETNPLTKVHEDWTKNVTSRFHNDWAKIVTSRVFTRNTAPPPGGHVFQRTLTIFELNQHIIKSNI
ncbi:hypothetical protein DPMN_123601 [Dreissena polymorpha]|uniref:Uncharacterized protein n=1 Tax=Dreissena polymorpha TaxID=45954 RepID=A0A9D4GU20_DREPO|nr:hypothetical protein DPMN_123601 [Dreissena polymorpha]